jgi:pseudouridine-5'-phosphate glycosidase
MLPGCTLSPDVLEMLSNRGAVVALETTIITHGLPYPANLDAARRLERAVRDEGAVPATIGVVDGRVHVGLEPDALDRLARGPAEKIQARGLPLAIARRLSGGTTVSATLHVAARCGIRVFATGGIGGVHRRADLTGDVSEDLFALSRERIAVVSSGAKAILDLPRTLEALESLGVPVIGFRTREFPAFYHARSGLAIPAVESADEIAAVMHAAWHAGELDRAVLVCNPPPEVVALPADDVARWIREALADADAQEVSGASLTPHLLAALDRTSGGATVRTNVALAESNARLAGAIAVAFARRRRDDAR